jgi:GT2 family glycosyltransferase
MVSVVIPSRDGRRFLERCLPALASSRLPPGAELEILVVDNGSSDGSALSAERFPRTRVLGFDRPLGFAAANNAARGQVRGDVIAFLNNDTEPEPDWLLRPIEILAGDARVAAVGAKLLFMHRYVPVAIRPAPGAEVLVADAIHGSCLDEKVRWAGDATPGRVGPISGRWVREEGAVVHVPQPIPRLDGLVTREPVLRLLGAGGAGPVAIQLSGRPPLRLLDLPGIALLDLTGARTVDLVQNAGTVLTRWGEGGDAGSGEPDGARWAREEVVPALCGAALLARRTALDRAGWFPPYYTMYYEDTDLSLRLRREGLLVFCPSSRVRHYHTGTSREGSPEFVEHVARSTLLFAARHAGPSVLRRALLRRVREVVRECRALSAAGPAALWQQARATRGTVRALAALPRVIAERLREGGEAGRLDRPRVPYGPGAELA